MNIITIPTEVLKSEFYLDYEDLTVTVTEDSRPHRMAGHSNPF